MNHQTLEQWYGAVLPERIREGEAFDGSLLVEKGFQPGRTYWIGPVIADTGGLRELIIYPDKQNHTCFEDSLYTCTFLTKALSILKTETYYLHMEPGKTRWVTKYLKKKARAEYVKIIMEPIWEEQEKRAIVEYYKKQIREAVKAYLRDTKKKQELPEEAVNLERSVEQ